MSTLQTRVGARYWVVGVIVGMVSYLDAAAIVTVAISLSIWQQHFALDAWQTGLLSSGLSMSFALGSLAGGWLADRIGRIRMLGYAIVAFVAGCLLMLTAPNGTLLVVGAVVVGFAAGSDLPTSLATVSELVPAAVRGRLIGLTQLLWIAGVLGAYLLGYAVSGLGHLGTQIMVAHLAGLGVLTWLLRTRLRVIAGVNPRIPAAGPRPGLRPLLNRGGLRLVLTLTGFLLAWNIAATTLGSFGPYFLIRVTGLTQSEATGLVLMTFPLSLAVAFVFVRLADTRWRDRLFVAGMILQIAAFAVGATTGGVVVWGMVLLVVLYSLSNTFAGEAAFKVWAQLLYPAEASSTATGFSIAVARFAAATVLLGVPTLISMNPSAMIWIQMGCVSLSGLIGLYITRRLIPRHRGEADG